MTQPFCCCGSQSRPCRAAFVSYGEVDFTPRLAMHETALSRQDALDAGVRWRVVECASGLRIEEGDPEDNRQKLREPLVMVGAPIGQCWDIEYLTEAGKWERT